MDEAAEDPRVAHRRRSRGCASSGSVPRGRARGDLVVVEEPLHVHVEHRGGCTSSGRPCGLPGTTSSSLRGSPSVRDRCGQADDLAGVRPCRGRRRRAAGRCRGRRRDSAEVDLSGCGRVSSPSSACGLCGRDEIDAVVAAPHRVDREVLVDVTSWRALPDRMRERQSCSGVPAGCTRRRWRPRRRRSSWCARTSAGTTRSTRWSGTRCSTAAARGRPAAGRQRPGRLRDRAEGGDGRDPGGGRGVRADLASRRRRARVRPHPGGVRPRRPPERLRRRRPDRIARPRPVSTWRNGRSRFASDPWTRRSPAYDPERQSPRRCAVRVRASVAERGTARDGATPCSAHAMVHPRLPRRRPRGGRPDCSTPRRLRQGSVFGLAEVISALRDDQPAVVAVLHDEVVGAVVTTVSGDRAWVVRLAIAEEWRGQGMAQVVAAARSRAHARRPARACPVLRPARGGAARGRPGERRLHPTARGGVLRQDRVGRVGAGGPARGPRRAVLPARLWDRPAA